MGKHAFKFISGKYQGGEFPTFPDDGELLIGRASDLDLVLVEDMVSRKHAKLLADGGDLSITDLGSTNGTFVNGEKIRRADLKRNDRILIGTSILKLIDEGEMTLEQSQRSPGAVKEMMNQLGSRASESSTMSGDLQEVPLPDLLQLFATNRKSGALSIKGADQGKIFIKNGQLQAATIVDHALPPLKAIARMMTWTTGNFQLEPLDETMKFPEAFTESTESILIDALRQVDEIRRIQSELPDGETKLVLCIPMMPRLSELSKNELDTLQSVLNFDTYQMVLDKDPRSDHAVVMDVHKLLREGYVEQD